LNIDTDDSSNPPSGVGVHERLSAGSKSMFTEMDKALDEAITGSHPDITQKELCILRWILWTIHDIGFGLYEEVVIRVSENEKNLFKNGKEIEDMIIVLCKKGIVQKIIGFSKLHLNTCCLCNCLCCNDKSIFVTEKSLSMHTSVEREALEAISGIFCKVLKEYFP
jgi:hypothetical protein